jgi:hypothetical protein
LLFSNIAFAWSYVFCSLTTLRVTITSLVCNFIVTLPQPHQWQTVFWYPVKVPFSNLDNWSDKIRHFYIVCWVPFLIRISFPKITFYVDVIVKLHYFCTVNEMIYLSPVLKPAFSLIFN